MSTIPRVPSAIDGTDASFLTVFAHQPGLADAFERLYGTLWSSGLVDQVTKETIRLRNTRVTDCGFCRQVRFSGPREAGLSEDIVSLIDDAYATSDLTDAQKVALHFTDVYLQGPSVPEPDLARELEQRWSAPEMVEMTLAVSMFLGFAKMLIALGTEPEPGTMPTMVLPTPDHTVVA